jgi:hypothetical protein
MKVIFTILFIGVFYNTLSQQVTHQKKDTCDKRKPLPCKKGFKLNKPLIDTIQAEQFLALTGQLAKKMTDSQDLNKEEARDFIKVMNTIGWSDWDKQTDSLEQFPALVTINKLSDTYLSKIRCQYGMCLGPGFSAYYIKLQVQYMGKPFVCNRYHVVK